MPRASRTAQIVRGRQGRSLLQWLATECRCHRVSAPTVRIPDVRELENAGTLYVPRSRIGRRLPRAIRSTPAPREALSSHCREWPYGWILVAGRAPTEVPDSS